MSIITEALDRLQTERARHARHPEALTTPESSEVSDSPAATVFSSHAPVLAPQRSLRRSVSLVLLGSVGIGVYLWGLPFSPGGDAGPSEHKAAAAKELNPAGRSQVGESIPGQRPVVKTTREARDVPVPSAQQSAASQTARPKVSEQSARQLAQTKPKPLAAAKQPSRGAVNSPSSRQQEKNVSRPRNATPGEVRLAHARHLIQTRRYERAVTTLRPLFVTPPKTWEPWFWLGTAQLGLGQWEEARNSLVEGLARDATVPQLWVQRALVSQQRGRFGEALDALRQAELLAPKFPEVQLNLAYSLEALGERQVAVTHYRTFLTLTEGNQAYHATRKKVLDRIIRLEKT